MFVTVVVSADRPLCRCLEASGSIWPQNDVTELYTWDFVLWMLNKTSISILKMYRVQQHWNTPPSPPECCGENVASASMSSQSSLQLKDLSFKLMSLRNAVRGICDERGRERVKGCWVGMYYINIIQLFKKKKCSCNFLTWQYYDLFFVYSV